MTNGCRQPQLWRGHIAAAGLFFPRSMISEAQARQRITALTEAPAAVYRHELGWIVLLHTPQWWDNRQAPGSLLQRCGGVLSNAPLPAGRSAARGAVCLWHGGQWHEVLCDEHQRVDPAQWFDRRGWSVRPVRPLGPQPQVADALPTLTVSAAEITPGPAPAAALQALLAKLKAAQAAPQSAVGERGSPAAGGFWRGWLLGWLQRPHNGGSSQSATTHHPQPAAVARRPSWLDRLLVATQVARLLGWRQALYLRRMLALFEDGNLDEALRHAIPLATLQELHQLTQAWGLPRRRSHLQLSPPAGGYGSGGIALSAAWTEHLRQLYRRSFDQLDRAGRIDEALFVLAELLQQHEEAVLYLEKHQRRRQAAELAELRQLAPALQVRLWFAAGERERAVALARRFGVYAQAVAELERLHSPLAASLRALWADDAASAGDLATAVRALWPVAAARRLALHWLAQARQQPDGPLPDLLVYELALAEQPQAVLAAARHLLHQPGTAAAQRRLALAQALLDDLQRCPEQRADHRPVLAAATVRALLADGAAGHPLGSVNLDKLLKASRNTTLRTDLPPLPTATVPTGTLSWQFADVGTQRIHAAAISTQGYLLLALGEAGVALLHADGREIHRFACPADGLAVADHGQLAIAIMRRGRVRVLNRLHLAQRRLEPWGEIPAGHWFAPDFDGQRWAVLVSNDLLQNSLLLLDVLAAQPRVLWRVGDLPGLLAARRDPDYLRLLTEFDPESGAAECWNYEMSTLLLRGRLPTRLPVARLVSSWDWSTPLLLGRHGELWAWVRAENTVDYALGRYDGQRLYEEVALPWLTSREDDLSGVVLGDHLAVWQSHARQVSVFSRTDAAQVTHLQLPQASAVTMWVQLQPELRLIVADDRGQVLSYAPVARQMRGVWRV